MDPDRTEMLLRRAQQEHEQDAIEELFSVYAPMVRRGLRRILGDRYRRQLGDSEDVTQDALIAAFQNLPRYEHRGGGSFLAWLLRLAERQVVDRLRQGEAQKRGGGQVGHLESLDAFDADAGGASPSQIAEGRETEERIRAAIDELPAQERDVILLKRYVGLDTDAIRDQMALPSAGAARALLSRAQTRLAERLTG